MVVHQACRFPGRWQGSTNNTIHPCFRKWAEWVDYRGGADVNPKLYGQEKTMLAKEVIRKKNTFYYSLIRILFYPLIYFFRKIFSVKYFIKRDDRRDLLEYHLIKKGLEKKYPFLVFAGGHNLSMCTWGAIALR